MSGVEEARRLLDMAAKDLKALAHMGDQSAFPDEIFGFHAQQAAEKILKSWLATLNREYPLTHDLSYLLRRLELARHRDPGTRFRRTRLKCLDRGPAGLDRSRPGWGRPGLVSGRYDASPLFAHADGPGKLTREI